MPYLSACGGDSRRRGDISSVCNCILPFTKKVIVSVCFFVNSITRTVVDDLMSFEGRDMRLATGDRMLVMIRTTLRIWEFFTGLSISHSVCLTAV